jgi:transposase
MDTNKQTAYTMHAAGKSYSEIAEELNTSKTTAFAWVKEVRMSKRGETSSPRTTHSNPTNRMKPRVKEPAHYIEQRQKIDELTSLTEQMSRELHSIQQKQIERERMRIQRLIDQVLENDGEIWSIDDLYETESELSVLREELLSIDVGQANWLEDTLDPIREALLEAAEQFEEDGLDECEVWFTE